MKYSVEQIIAQTVEATRQVTLEEVFKDIGIYFKHASGCPCLDSKNIDDCGCGYIEMFAKYEDYIIPKKG